MIADPRRYSVQARPNNLSLLRYEQFSVLARKALLPRRGLYSREVALWRWYYNDYNLLFRSAVAGLVKRVQSTPWEIIADDDTDYYQQMLLDADFGTGWDAFLSRVIIPFFRSDIGGLIEIIGPGNPNDPLIGRPQAIAALDGTRTLPTGDPNYPIVYFSGDGWHRIHHTRVVQIADNLDSDYEGLVGYGDCALARYIAAVHREQSMGQYVDTYLDDKPRPGVAIFSNVSAGQRNDALDAMLNELDRDDGGMWGRTLVLQNMQLENKASVDHYTFSDAPEKFDFEAYTQLDVKLLALALGVDIQDVWELTGGGIGTGTQSQILAAKSKGKALGRLLKSIERIINQTLPPDIQFTFKYNDADEDEQRAAIANQWAQFVATAQELPIEVRNTILRNQVEAVSDAYRDIESESERLDDTDIEPDGTDIEPVIDAERAFGSTQPTFIRAFMNAYRAAKDPLLPNAVPITSMMRALQDAGREEFLQGMRDAGVENPSIDRDGQGAIQFWLTQQRGFVNKLISDFVTDETLTESKVRDRADLWLNKSLRNIYYEGVDYGTPGGVMYEWSIDAAKENCRTCLRLNGQRHRYQTFKRRNLVPGSAALECGGWQCGCVLKQMPAGTRARGNIRSVPYLRGTRGLNDYDYEGDHTCECGHHELCEVA